MYGMYQAHVSSNTNHVAAAILCNFSFLEYGAVIVFTVKNKPTYEQYCGGILACTGLLSLVVKQSVENSTKPVAL